MHMAIGTDVSKMLYTVGNGSGEPGDDTQDHSEPLSQLSLDH